MKKKIIAIVIGILCVIVAAIGLFQFAFKTKATYVKDVDSDKFNKAYDLLANAYLEDGEEADVYYTDFIKKNTEAGEGEHKATLTNGVDSVKYYEENNNEDNQLPEDVKTYSDKMIELEYQKSANYKVNVEKAGCEYLHIDVMDGHFVPNITLGPGIVKSLRKDVNMVFDAHLMIENPDNYIKEFADAGCDIIVVHQEACTHLHRTIQNIKSHGIKAGVALNPATPIETIKYVLQDVDMVLLMSVNPGFGGQSYIPVVTEKIKELKALIDEMNLDIDIEVDGGVKPSNIAEVVNAGANVIVAGSAIFNAGNIDEAVKSLRENASK